MPSVLVNLLENIKEDDPKYNQAAKEVAATTYQGKLDKLFG